MAWKKKWYEVEVNWKAKKQDFETPGRIAE